MANLGDWKPCSWHPFCSACLLHFIVLLGGSGYSFIPNINFTERPAAIALLAEKRNWSHDDGIY